MGLAHPPGKRIRQEMKKNKKKMKRKETPCVGQTI
jgi:hypothetical protein